MITTDRFMNQNGKRYFFTRIDRFDFEELREIEIEEYELRENEEE